MGGIETKGNHLLRVIANPDQPPFTQLSVNQLIRTEIIPDPYRIPLRSKIAETSIGTFLKTARRIAEEKGLPLIIEFKDIQ